MIQSYKTLKLSGTRPQFISHFAALKQFFSLPKIYSNYSESERFGNIITGLQIPLLTGSTSSIRSNPRLNEIKEEN